jgi:hypothetical protein
LGWWVGVGVGRVSVREFRNLLILRTAAAGAKMGAADAAYLGTAGGTPGTTPTPTSMHVPPHTHKCTRVCAASEGQAVVPYVASNLQ